MSGAGGFAAVIGGAGDAAAHYGSQVRGLLEQRRGHFIDLLSQEAANETDPMMRGQIHQSLADLISGKPMDKIVAPFLKAVQTKHEGDQALAEATGGPGQAPAAPPPGPAGPGQTPGAPKGLSSGPSAAMPSTSIVAPGSQSTPAMASLIGQPSQPTTMPQTAPATVPQQAQPAAMGARPQQLNLPVSDSLSQAMAPSTTPPMPQQAPQAQASPDSLPTTYLGHPLGYWLSTPKGTQMLREGMQPYYANQAEFARQEHFARIELGWKQKALDEYKSTPEWQATPAMLRGQWQMWASTPGQQMPSMLGMMSAFRTVAEPANAENLESQFPGILAKFGIDPKKTPTVRVIYNQAALSQGQTIPEMVFGETPTMGTFGDIYGSQFVAPRVPGTPQAPGGGSAVSPTAIPRVSNTTTTVPGEPTQTQHVERGIGTRPQTAPATVPPVASGKAPISLDALLHSDQATGAPVTPATGPLVGIGPVRVVSPELGAMAKDPAARAAYEAWKAGGPAPTGKKLTGVQMYADANGLPLPVPLSAAGQKDITAVDDVLKQIHMLRARLEQAKLQNDNTHGAYTDYLRSQRLGEVTPLGDFWNGQAFTGLRSVGAALSGVSTRGQFIYNDAKQHVPVTNLPFDPLHPTATRLPDTPAKMYEKLGTMEKILTSRRGTILEDETKSGVIRPLAGASGSIPTINTQAEYDALPAGSKYIDKQTGQTGTKK